MLVDTQRKRILLTDGTSLLSDDVFIKHMLAGDVSESMRVLESEDSRLYEKFYGDIISSDGSEDDLVGSSHQHTDDEFDELLLSLFNSNRLAALGEAAEKHEERVYEEIEFFARTQNIKFLLAVRDVIGKFRENGVVWGVGRGSACASLVLYLLEVHDVDPVLFDIPFSELSKEQKSDD